MSSWLVALITGFSVAAYLAAGYAIGRMHARWAYDLTDLSPYALNMPRTNALIAFYIGLLFWPITGIVALFCQFDSMVPQIREEKIREKRKAHRQELAEAQAEIDRLHKQLGIAPIRDVS